jgi:predicted GNAT superfamily acetyltransferase
LRSQVTGTVRPRRGVGEALKRHQRAWAEAQGMRRVTWTFDPLVRTNAHFNVGRLGARIVRFVPDFYGSLDDGLNGSDETDRCVVSWEIHTDREGAAPVSSADLLLDDHQLLLASDDVDEPLLAAPTGRRLLVATPSDVVALRRTHPALARRWRHAVRDAFRTAFAAGLVADRVTTDGCYRFRPPEQGA